MHKHIAGCGFSVAQPPAKPRSYPATLTVLEHALSHMTIHHLSLYLRTICSSLHHSNIDITLSVLDIIVSVLKYPACGPVAIVTMPEAARYSQLDKGLSNKEQPSSSYQAAGEVTWSKSITGEAEPYSGAQLSPWNRAAGEVTRSKSTMGEAEPYSGAQLSPWYRAAGEVTRSESITGEAEPYSGAQLSPWNRAAGEVTRKKITTVKSEPPPEYIGARSNYSSNLIQAPTSTSSRSSEQSTTCRFCKHDNPGSDTRYYSSYSSYSAFFSNRCTNCHRMW